MRALHVVANINREVGGPAVTVSQLALTLARLSVETTLATLDYAALGPQPALPGVRVESTVANALTRGLRGWSPGFARKLNELAAGGADVVHNHGLWMFPNYYARRAASANRVPLVVSPRGMLDEWSLRRSRIRKFVAWRLFERQNLALAQLFHATSAAEAQAVRRAGLTQPIAVIPNGVNVPRGEDVPDRALLEAAFPAMRGKRWLLFLSRLHPKKGVAELLRVWRAVEARHAGWHLVLAGPELDGYGAAMRRLAGELGVSDRTTFTGMLLGKAKSCALGNSELLVLPTHSENFGLVVAEALAHGVPVVTTRAAPWPGLLRENCGWWIDDNEAELRATLEFALQVPGPDLEAMGVRGREMVSREYGWDRVAKDMLSVYFWLSGNGDRPDCVELR
jgi:glycosyltransferase involved in cell wall biosynthesis